MNMKTKTRFWTAFLAVCLVLVGILSDVSEAEARRGGGGGRSFGGSRRSSTPRYSPSRPSAPSSPTTRSRTTTGSRSTSGSTTTSRPSSSFGGSRLSSSQDYTRSYGTPRRTESMTARNAQGVTESYNVNRYGGMSDGFMLGYMTGQTSWMWSMPFHPAFYYSRPYEVRNANGTIDVYPPTFSWGKLLITVVVVGGVAYLIYRAVRRRRSSPAVPTSSFG